MGGGFYSSERTSMRSVSKGYASKSAGEIFQQRNINSAMDPYGVTVRESLDSDEHPNTTPIIIALDVTGSMGSIPHHLVKQGFPTIMETVIKAGVTDPQVLFLGIGDHECDRSPLQVGQFESSDELLDKWLTSVYLEGGGGGNDGESYHLAWHFAGNHTKIDSFDKRGKKGFLFTIGDEPTLTKLPDYAIKQIMGGEQASTKTASELLNKACEKYNVFHIHVKETRAGQMQSTVDGWKQLIQDGLLFADRKEEIPGIIGKTIVDFATTSSQGQQTETVSVPKPEVFTIKEDEMML